jgi:hypothetical protein
MRTDTRLALAANSSFISDSRPSLLTYLDRLSYQRGEECLMLAILKDAIDCIERHCYGRHTGGRSDCEAALAWVRTQDTRWVFSFENICLTLDLNPSRLRVAIESLAPRSTTKTRANTSPLTASAIPRLALR